MEKEQIIEVEIPNRLSGKMKRDGIERIARALPKATEDNMGDIPLWLLYDLAIVCYELNLQEELQKVLIEIQMNLEMKQEAKEMKIKADLAEQRAERAEQKAKEAKQIYQQAKSFMERMEKKYGV
uniref:alanine-zipper protein n=1 Tax=Campylobacter lari TaxID=201 RepID=UPI0015950B05|nr:alanine-zipper protein [Campylobacter lari]